MDTQMTSHVERVDNGVVYSTQAAVGNAFPLSCQGHGLLCMIYAPLAGECALKRREPTVKRRVRHSPIETGRAPRR